MADIIPDGQPIEEPEASAAAPYQNIPAPLGQFLGEQIGSTVRQIGRVAEQGMFEGAGAFPQFLYGLTQAGTAMPEATVGGVPSTTEVTPPGSVPTPMLSPEDYNARYAPNGPDGKPVSLGSEPMPQGIAKLVGDAKREEIERDNVSSRFESAHSWPTNFAANALGFMLDPLRAATAFVPGLGEEAILARLGTSIAARLGARVIAGATAGAAAQAPLAVLQYGLGQEEASDYGLRDAFRDMAFAAAGNAIFHTGVGTATELLRGRPEAAAEAPMEFREAAPIMAADAQTQHAAMSSAVAEIADGRPVDVEPMFQLKTPEPIEGVRFLTPPPRPYRLGDSVYSFDEKSYPGLPGFYDVDVRDRAGATVATAEVGFTNNGATAKIDFVRRGVRDNEEDQRSLFAGANTLGPSAVRQIIRDYFLSHPEVKEISGQRIYGARASNPFLSEHDPDAAFTVARHQAIGRLSPTDIAAQQRELYHDGFAPGVPGSELRETSADIYAPPPEAEAVAQEPEKPAEAAALEAPQQPGITVAEEGKPLAETDPELAAAHERIQQIEGGLLPEERAELEQVRGGLADAETKSAAINEAANCLKEAGM